MKAITFDVGSWSVRTFGPQPNRLRMIKEKLIEEVNEFNSAEGFDCGIEAEAEELADMAILLMGYAYRRGIDLGQAIRDKHKVNKKRKWVRSKGAYRHV